MKWVSFGLTLLSIVLVFAFVFGSIGFGVNQYNHISHKNLTHLVMVLWAWVIFLKKMVHGGIANDKAIFN